MANLCLENAQFLNETTLDVFNFILDEFSNEYNYLQNIDEVSISDSINTAINKLKELWKSFAEWVKDTIRKVKVKLIQLLVELKHRKNRKQKDKNPESDKESDDNIKLLSAKSKTTEDEEKALEDEERKRRENNKNKHNVPNDEVIKANAPDKVITINFYNSFAKNNVKPSLSDHMATDCENGFNRLCGRIFRTIEGKSNRVVPSEKYDIFYEILKNFDGNNNTNYTFDKNKSINENIHNALLGSSKDKIKVIFNNNNGYDTNRIINDYLSNLDGYYKLIDSVSKDLNDRIDMIKEDNIEDRIRTSAIADMQKIVEIAKNIIKSIIECDMEAILMFYKILNHWLYNNDNAPNATLYKYVKFEEA